MRWAQARIAGLGERALAGIATGLAIWMMWVSVLAGTIRTSRVLQLGRKSQPTNLSRATGELVKQLHGMGNHSLVFITMTLGLIGMVMVYQGCQQIDRVTGDLSQVGPQFLRLVIADFAPTLTSLMLATRIGAAMAAELGTMTVTDQVDAMRLCGVLPIDFLVVPRFWACTIATVVLSIYGGVIMYAAGGLIATKGFDLNPAIYFDMSLVTGAHVSMFLCKAISYGMALPVIAAYTGLAAEPGQDGVGQAATRAVLGGSLAVITLDLLWTSFGFIVLGARL